MNKGVNYLDKIDDYFSLKPNNVFYACAVLLFVAVFYLVYDYTYEDSEVYVNEIVEKTNEMTKTIESLQAFIDNNNSRAAVPNMQKRLQDLRKEEKTINDDTAFFDNKLKEISPLLFNQKNWSKFITKINSQAMKNNLIIGDIQSRLNDAHSRKVEEIFNISFSIKGKFQDILRFINSLEESEDIVDITSIKMYSNKKYLNLENNQNNNQNNNSNNVEEDDGSIKTELKISIWGIKY